MSIVDVIAASVWAIEESWLRAILEIAAREGEGPDAVAAKLGRPLNNTRTVTVRDGVAVVPVTGPIFRRANLLTEVSGATSTELLARDFRAALDDPTVKALLLDVDSPGGQADGVNELANMIFEARGQKPILAYVSGMAASGAYWIASAADEIVIDDTARLGSIGVVAAYRDTKARDEKMGVKQIEFVSSQSPNKRPNLDSDDGRGQIQQQIDAIAEVFIGAVARNRDVSREAVVSDFGAGGIKVGTAAVEAGLADRQGSLEGAISELAAYDPLGAARKKPRRRIMAKPKAVEPTTEERDEGIVTDEATIAKLTAEARAQGVEEGKALGIAEGAKVERERILGIEAVAMPGHEKLVAELKADGKTTPADAAVKQAMVEKETRTKRLEALKSDGTVAVPATPTATGEAATVTDASHLPLDERCKAQWEKDAELRSEFGDDFAAYVAFEKAQSKGLVKILGRRAS